MKALKVIGWILVIFGILDFALYYLADVDLTGVSWSPYIAGALGWGLIEIAKKKNDDNNSDNDTGAGSGEEKEGNQNSKTEKAKSIIGTVADIADDLLG